MRKEIDILKAIAVFAVIFLHFNSNLFYHIPYFSLGWNRTLVFDQILRFCVPLFVAISGFTLAGKYLKAPLDLKDFYLRRVTKLLPLYFLWSAIILLTLRFVPGWSSPSWHPSLFELIFQGHADYHLYFVPMIFQLYLLFPLLFWLTQKNSWLPLLAALLVQSVVFIYFAHNPQWADQEQYIFSGSWIFFFELGIFLAKKEVVIPKTWWLFLLLFILFFVSLFVEIKDAFNILAQKVDVIVAAKSTRFSVMAYATSFILLSVFFGEWLVKLPGILVNILVYLGKKSYLIYLFHTLILRVIFEPQYNPGWDPAKMTEVLLIVAGGVLLSELPGIIKKFATFQTIGQKA